MRIRNFMLLIIAMSSGSLMPAPAEAQSYPSRPIRMVVPFPPGGSLDLTMRVIGPKMTELIGQNVIIDSRPGADGNIGTEIVARSPADGYTVLIHAVPLVVNPSLRRKLPFDVNKDFVPVSLLTASPLVLVVNPSVPAKSIKELLAIAKAHPGKLTYASAGNGSNLHMAAELLNNITGSKMLHVVYKGGGPALVAVLSGEVDLSYLNIGAIMGYAKSGRLRALGITSAKRSPLMPDVPTIAESGAPGYEFTAWAAALVPAGTPGNVVTALYEAFAKALRSPEAEKRFAEQGAVIVASPPDEFAKFFKAELAKWARVVKETGIKAE
ncbi:MAG: tripartite tricarboxylate transporter substrate binding protein [Betaproteobacteria bacterium]|nr:tripartite tricarboxylate transporter substrate binding protein [Betaproteobacteria bacterium]